MDNSSDEYHISFFKPTTPQAIANRNIVVWFVLIWFFAIFGFQILLRVIEKPTPEPAYVTFQNVWGDIKTGSPSVTQLQQFAQASLSVLGKLAISPEERRALDNALSSTLYQLTDDAFRADIVAKVQEFEKIKEGISDISDQAYINAKISLSAEFSPMLNLSSLDVRSKILPLELTSESMNILTDDTKNNLPGIMKKYLVHNQSFLTDMKFLGFPFHYFYTAIFLLILFVGLCWLYCVKIDSLNAKLNIVD
jgi:putative solute:sodium symporter small subunit